MLSRFRLALRIQRFEVWSCVLLVAVVGITALIVRARLEGVRAPVECLTPWIFPDVAYDATRCLPLMAAFFQIRDEEAALVMTAMDVLPLLVGLLLGVGLVGGEIEGGTAPTVWALAGSRRRWLLGRLVPILLILVALLVFAAITSDMLAAAKVPWQFGPTIVRRCRTSRCGRGRSRLGRIRGCARRRGVVRSHAPDHPAQCPPGRMPDHRWVPAPRDVGRRQRARGRRSVSVQRRI